MATRTIRKVLFSSPVFRQNEDSTWDGINQNYLNAFKTSGCFLCALTMITAYMEENPALMPYNLVARGVTSTTSPYIDSYNVSNEFILREYKSENYTTNQLIQKIAKSVVEDDTPVFIQVDGHAVVAYGYYGEVNITTSGKPIVSNASAENIRFYDPYMGRYDNNYSGLIGTYGDILKIRIPE